MSILRFTASADTTITDAFRPYTTSRSYYSNMGAADSLELFSIYHSGSSPEKSRILLNFPINEISQSRTEGNIPSAGNVSFILKLYNVEHPETLPKNYSVLVKPISGSWDEGYGLDLENYSDIGQTQTGGFGVGWKFRSTTEVPYVWSADGGDYYSGYDKVFHFDNGIEDVELDITDVIEAQISNILPHNGIGVMLSGSFENGTNNTTYYTKRFSARSSEYFYKIPSVEARWETFIKDDRGNFFFESANLESSDNTQNIYFYNKINGTLKNLPNNTIPFVKLLNEESVEITSSIPTVKVQDGVYKASFSITGSDDSLLSDVWYSGSSTYFTSTIEAKVRTFEDTSTNNEYVFNITNLKNIYKNYETPTIKVYSRTKDWSPNIYNTSQNTIETLSFNNLYYKVFRIVDNLTIIDYGADPIAYTKCSYDKNGNYFDLNMSILEPGYAYGIKLALIDDKQKLEIPNIYRFKVE